MSIQIRRGERIWGRGTHDDEVGVRWLFYMLFEMPERWDRHKISHNPGLWHFILGVLYGRGTAINKKKKKLGRLVRWRQPPTRCIRHTNQNNGGYTAMAPHRYSCGCDVSTLQAKACIRISVPLKVHEFALDECRKCCGCLTRRRMVCVYMTGPRDAYLKAKYVLRVTERVGSQLNIRGSRQIHSGAVRQEPGA
jgi:hypothetical protein